MLLAVVVMLAWTGCAPSGPQALMKGEALLKQGDLPGAVKMLERAVREIPEQAQAWNHLGLAYHYSGQRDKAVAAYNSALEKNRNLAVVHHNLARLYLERGDLNPAIDSLTRYLILKPEAQDAWLDLGICQLKTRQWDAAERTLLAYARSNPRSVEALNGLGLIQVQRRKYREAYTQFHAASQVQPVQAAAVLNMATVAFQHLRYRDFGLQKYREFLALSPNAEAAAAVRLLVQHLDAATNSVPKLMAQSATNTMRISPAPPVLPAASSPSLPAPPAGPSNLAAQPAPFRTTSPQPPPAVTQPAPSRTVTNTPPVPPPVIASAKPPTPQPAPPQEPEPERLPVKVVERPDEEVKPVAALRPSPLPEAVQSDKPEETPSVAETLQVPSPPAARPGLLSRLNPQGWFRKTEKQPTPLSENPVPRRTAPSTTPLKEPVKPAKPKESTTGPQASSAEAPVERPQSATTPAIPSYARYRYVSPQAPKPGDREQAELAFTEGAQAQEKGQLTVAIGRYQAAVQADPSYFEAYYNMAIAASRAGDTLGSLAAYERSLAVQPKSLTARFNFAVALQKANYPEDAAAEFERLASDHPGQSRAHFALGNLYAQSLFRTDLARKHYARVLELEPSHSQAAAMRQWLARNP